MRFRKPDHCYFCGKELRWREETHSDHAPRKPQAPPSVALPPTDGSPPPSPTNRLGRAPGSDRPDVSPKGPGPLLSQPPARRDYIKLDPDAVRELLISLHARGFSVAVLAGLTGRTPQTIRQWMTRRGPPESDDRT